MDSIPLAKPPGDMPGQAIDTPLTVAIVCTQRHWHGGEEQAALLAAGLKRAGHRCKILARHGSAFAQRMAARRFTVCSFTGRGRLPHALWQIRRSLVRWRPDVVYYNDPHAVTAAGLASLGLGIPLRVAARRVDFPLHNVSRYRRMSDGLICVSRAVQDVCRQAGLAPERLHVVHDGVDPSRMQGGNRQRGRHALGIPADAKMLLTVAKLTDHKGHRYLLESMPSLIRQHQDLHWVVAGDGPLWEPLQRQAAELGVQPNVHFLGYRHDIPDLMAAADMMVIPSHMEGLCSSIVDAMLIGLPVVATRAGGIPDLLGGRNATEPSVGWLVPPKDPSQLAKAVLDVIRFPRLTQQRADAAYHRAMNEFTDSEMVQRTVRAFHAMLLQKAEVPRAA